MTWHCKRRGRFLNWEVYNSQNQTIGEFVRLEHAELVCKLFNEHCEKTMVTLQEIIDDGLHIP